MEVTTTYRIRPHHGMCLYFFEGKGYSEGFTKHMAEVNIQCSTPTNDP